jgi:hypothetical protein
MNRKHILLTFGLLLSALTASAQTWDIGGNSSPFPGGPYLGTMTHDSLVLITNNQRRIFIHPDGNVGIGTSAHTGFRLSVEGMMRARAVRINPYTWSDFVFKPGYSYPSYQSLESFIKEKGHLPGMPSEQDVIKEGTDVGDIQAKLLEQIEVLNLRVLELNKRIAQLEEEKKKGR